MFIKFYHIVAGYSSSHIFFSFSLCGKKYFWHEWCKLASACRCLMLKKLKDTYRRGRENLISWYPYINVWIIWILLTHPFYSSPKAWNYIRYKNRMVIFRSEHCHIFTFPFVFLPFDYWIIYILILHATYKNITEYRVIFIFLVYHEYMVFRTFCYHKVLHLTTRTLQW